MVSIESRRQNRFWNILLNIISKGNVVPIIGEELLKLPNYKDKKLYHVLAERYAELSNYKLDPSRPADLSATIRSHPEFRDNPHDIYQELAEEYEYLKPGIPEPLQALAKIRHFNLFISTTFDNLLEQAINEERFGGRRLTEIIAYSPKNTPSDKEISEKLNSSNPVIFQIFGNYKNPLEFALTEGDIVEYMHSLQSTEYCPRRIFCELHERPLLMLGNSFSNWLARFFLRMTRKTPLDYREVPKQYFADAEVNSDPLLKFFLRNFTTNTELIDNIDPIQFISELVEKWQERFKGQKVPIVSEARECAKAMPKNAVFISYCSSDVNGCVSRDTQAAIAIRDALEASGVNVWLDKDWLQGGDEYERKINRYIKTCSLFLPIISKTTESRDSGFFRKEWAWALNRLPDFTGSDRQFLFPVVIDDLDLYQAKIPDEFRNTQFTVLPNGLPDTNFVNRARWLYNKAQLPAVGTPA